ncbi:calcium-dependent phosphotriesterase [Teratosphaeria destructans]|uniref:Calcium-dependent phosphotriesterase n=1 Tax=Teratosphaeria destructans TaxID=418781 RepID=A0A9W7SZR6_9PEZI|nr:calcium-dependent phosphotriesterase [Teratosphaeria destructans]
MVNIFHVDLLRLASSLQYALELDGVISGSTSEVSFVSYSDSFRDLLGPDVSSELVATRDWKAFHEAGVYSQATGKIYLSSKSGNAVEDPINVTSIDIKNGDAIASQRIDGIANANGGAAFYPFGTSPHSSDGQQIVFCDQGTPNTQPGLVAFDPQSGSTKVLVNTFLGRNFSSPNDVVQHPQTGDLWFTDPPYAYIQGFRPAPTSRQQVYRFEPNTGVIQAVADGFDAPNGIELSPDLKHLYVTDSGYAGIPHFFVNETGPASVYRFDITGDGKRLENRQLFAYVDEGIPDGIHADTAGNVWIGVGDGVNVYNTEGILIGKFAVAGGAANFIFAPNGIYIFNEYKLFKVTGLKAEGRTVKRDYGK